MDEVIAGLFVLSLDGVPQTAKKNRVPLQSIDVQASIAHIACQVTIRQEYLNTHSSHIEAVYRFPIDEQAAVCGFEAEIGERKVVGVVKAKEDAKAEYKEALAKGEGAYLLEQASADVFEMQVGNIPPSTRVVVTIKYVTQLTWSGTKLRFFLPHAIVPRYGEGDNALTNPSGKATGKAAYTFSIQMFLQMLSRILGYSSTLPIVTKIKGNQGDVTLANRMGLSKDFEVLITVQDPHTPSAAIEYDESRDSYALLLSFIPLIKTTMLNTEMVLVVDRSGSMAGNPILQARETLQTIVNSLPDGVFFNIIGFGTEFKMLFPNSVPATKENVVTALFSIASLEADLGGTELLRPLEAIFASPPQPHCSRQLMILTDGAVSNSPQVIDCVRKASASTRVFTFGIGNGVSRELVSGMARAGGGAAEFILNLTRLKEQVMLQFKRALQPAITDITFQWQGVEAQVFPFVPRPLFHMEPSQVLVFLPKAEPQTLNFALQGRLPSGTMASFPLPVDLRNATRGTVIHSLVAREAIRDLEEGASYLHCQTPKASESQIKNEIIRLGLAYNLASQHTSFLAIEEREEKTKPVAIKKPKRVDVPQYQAAGRTGAGNPRGRPREKTLLDNLRSPNKKQKQTDSSAVSSRPPASRARRIKFRARAAYLQTPFGFSVPAATSTWLTYGDSTKAWSPMLSHGFPGPRGHKHLCWLTSSLALVMTVTPWREALLHLSMTRSLLNDCENMNDVQNGAFDRPNLEILVKAVSKAVKSWYALSDCRPNCKKNLVACKRNVNESLVQLSAVFANVYGMAIGQDQSVLECVHLIAIALSTCLSPRAMNNVQIFTLGEPEPGLLPYSPLAVSSSSRFLVLLNPACSLMPSLDQNGFALYSFLGLEKFLQPVVLEHAVCLAKQGEGMWMFDDNLNGGKGFQGGLINYDLSRGVSQHFQERVPVLVYRKN